MVDAPVLVVRGEAVREVPPDIARFTVTAAARDRDHVETLSRLAQRDTAIRAIVDSFRDAVERWETGGLHVQPELKRSGERVTAYYASVTTTVTVRDFTALGELMLRLANVEHVSLAGPWWELRPDSPVHRELRHAAVADALTRAREYAEAVGARVTRLLELADTGPGVEPLLARPMAYDVSAATAVPELSLNPPLQSVRAAVTARFAISAPTALDGGDAS
jgi:uncharacterized protein YggE